MGCYQQSIIVKFKYLTSTQQLQMILNFTFSGSLLSLSQKVSPELPVNPGSPTGGGVCAQPPPSVGCRWEGGVLVQPTNGRELWRMNCAGLNAGGGGRVGGGGGIWEEVKEAADGA